MGERLSECTTWANRVLPCDLYGTILYNEETARSIALRGRERERRERERGGEREGGERER